MLPRANDLRFNSTHAHDRAWLRQDIPQIAQLLHDLSLEYEPDRDWRIEPSRLEAWLNKTFNDAWHYFHVIRVSERIVAIAALAPSRIPDIDGLLHSVYVTPEFRDYGFGRKVTTGVLDYATTVGMSCIEMPMTTNPLAKRLYLSMGFEIYAHEGEAHMFRALGIFR